MATSVLRRTRRAGIGICMALTLVDLCAQQATAARASAPAASAQASTGTGAITGTVVDAMTDRPVGNAIVVLQDRGPRSPGRPLTQITTPTGRFAFVDLPASDMYFLTAAKGGYLDGGYRRADPRGAGAPLAVSEGQWVRDVSVTVARPGSIGGTVVDERGEPVVGVHVRALPQILIAGRTQWLAGPVARTDDRGEYRISGLGPGKYVVSVPSVQANLPASATVQAPGAGTGTSGADVRAAFAAAREERLLVDAGGGQHLVVGRYAVSPPPTADGQRTAYPIAFYPNAAAIADAVPIDLHAGEDRLGADVQLRPVRTASLSGTVTGPPDAVANLALRLLPAGLAELGQGSEAATTVTLADGRFTFLDVPNGSYVLEATHVLLELMYSSMADMRTALPAPVAFPARSAMARGVRAAPPGVQISALRDGAEVGYWGRLPVEVGGRDVDGLALELRRPARLSGEIVWAPGAAPSSNVPNPVLEPADGRRSLGLLTPSSRPRDGAAFTFDNLMAGEYVLRIGIGTNVVVESIMWDGRDYAERPFDASSGQDITGVVVTLTTAASSIAGIVQDGVTPLASGAAVIAFPVEREQWSNYGFNPPRLTSVLTTSDGRFRLDGLPAGEYYLVAVAPEHAQSWIDPSFLAGHVAQAFRVRVDRNDAVISNLALRLVR